MMDRSYRLGGGGGGASGSVAGVVDVEAVVNGIRVRRPWYKVGERERDG